MRTHERTKFKLNMKIVVGNKTSIHFLHRHYHGRFEVVRFMDTKYGVKDEMKCAMFIIILELKLSDMLDYYLSMYYEVIIFKNFIKVKCLAFL